MKCPIKGHRDRTHSAVLRHSYNSPVVPAVMLPKHVAWYATSLATALGRAPTRVSLEHYSDRRV